MSRIKTSERVIPRIYRRKYEDIAMMFYVDGQRDLVPAISIEKAIYNYFKRVKEEDFNIDTARQTYQRIKKEYYELERL